MADEHVQYAAQRPNEFAWSRESRPRQFNLADWLVKKGIGKNTKQAEYILLGITVAAIVVAAVVFAHGSSSSMGAPRLLNEKAQLYPSSYYQPGGAAAPTHAQ